LPNPHRRTARGARNIPGAAAIVNEVARRCHFATPTALLDQTASPKPEQAAKS
jgi:hypothetical protein